MTLSKKQLISLVLLVGLLLILPLVLFLTKKRQDIRPRALVGAANFKLSASKTADVGVGESINVLVSLQLVDNPKIKISGADFVLLYDKNKLAVSSLTPVIGGDQAFSSAVKTDSSGSFDSTYNFVRVALVAKKPTATLSGATVSLVNITFKALTSGAADIKFADDKYQEVVGIETN